MYSTPSLKLLLLTALARPLLAANNFCGFEVLGVTTQGQTAFDSSTDACGVEILIAIGADNCTDNTVFSGALAYEDIGGVAQNAVGLASATYPGSGGSTTETISFAVPYSTISMGSPVTASIFFSNALSGIGNFPVTWTQQTILVSTNVAATSTIISTFGQSTSTTITVTATNTVTTTPSPVTATTSGTQTVVVNGGTITRTSTITPRPRTVNEVVVTTSTITNACGPFAAPVPIRGGPAGRGGFGGFIRERQVCWELPDFTDTQTTTTFTTTVIMNTQSVTTTDTASLFSFTTTSPTVTASTPTVFISAFSTVTSTQPVVTRTVFSVVPRVTTTVIRTSTVDVQSFPRNVPCLPAPRRPGPIPNRGIRNFRR